MDIRTDSSGEDAGAALTGPGRADAHFPDVEIEIIDRPAALKALEADWRDLYARGGGHSYYLTFDWHWRAWDHYARRKGRRLLVVVLRQAGRVVLILPLAVERYLIWRRAHWLGAVTCYYEDALVEPSPRAPDWLAVAWKAVTKSRVDFCMFRAVRDDAALSPLLAGIKGGWKEDSPSLHVAWDDWPDWSDYWSSMRDGFRWDQRRQRRRLAKRGQLKFETVSAADDVDETLRWIIEKKRDWLRVRGYYGDRYGEAERAFLHGVVADARASGALHMARVKIGAQPIAAEFGFVQDREMHLAVTSYDQAWQSYSPGRMMFEESLKWSRQSGLRIFDLNSAEDDYKRIWARREAGGANYFVPCTLLGRLYVSWYASPIRTWLRLAYALTPTGLRKRVRKRLFE